MLREQVDQNPLLTFFVVTFGWTWGWDALYFTFGWWDTVPTTFPRQWGVPIGAIVVVWASEVSLQSWLRNVLDWRVRPSLYLVALLVPFAITNVREVFRALGGGSLAYAPPGALYLILLFLFANTLLFGGVEEIGWRGFLQPRLQEHTSVLTAGIGIGVVWWAWHLPLFLGHRNFVLEPVPLLAYTVFVIGASVAFGAFVNVTGGSVLPVMVMHASTNVGALLEGSGGTLDSSALLTLVVGSGSWWLIVFALVVLFGRSLTPEFRSHSGPRVDP
ncbi:MULTISPECIES: CPBP family intramembrane glutamic endopeptidase [Halolamina]|uniref:CDP-diacylglycerol--glycerol-3-phosphate 3-phosphatidyltransferase n=1 Tax=Halolamina pelagica TaxID=699431 RepID=A0A1I5NW02_9EURY|nr:MULTISPECIES: CPBP family intramembrane glutamic endopeptidase [Halolamina]NHX36501.1 CPBP family intramembrane metalloprotease [Halolamina sp. R1-12]SFP25810.1 CDP-diacylglycerol--glycerol-3-phosphate 3-phosphatidyltransferase [Halolamina pelagica]